mmetsp:Transcript_85866/g.228927  ORF Transcript_85866/g.228927 Transcript_85866/m.228927 type:complete len:90 (-) Transcript_85866:133-402(-)
MIHCRSSSPLNSSSSNSSSNSDESLSFAIVGIVDFDLFRNGPEDALSLSLSLDSFETESKFSKENSKNPLPRCCFYCSQMYRCCLSVLS